MTDYSKYKNLYLLCFTDDTEQDAEYLFKNVLSKANLVCEYDENKNPVSMLFLMDCNISEDGQAFPYYYLYAACTHPDHRGKGIMGRLLEKAKQIAMENNKLGIFLKPANAPLFDFYKKSGFLPFFNVCKINMELNNLTNVFPPCLDNTQQTTMDLWHGLRKNFLNSLNCTYADFSKNILTTAADGSTPIISDRFGFVYELRGTTLLIKEALCQKGNTKELMCAVSNIANSQPCKNVEIRLPETLKDELAQFGDIVKPFSVMWHSPETTKQYKGSTYHGFAFD